MAAKSTKILWTGRVISVLSILPFIPSAIFKFVDGPEVVKGFTHLGLPMSLRIPLGILEISCVIVYLIPQTAVLGAILLTGYIGGAMLTHLRIGEAVYIHIAIGILVWLGLYLRENRLKALIPLRTRSVLQ